MRYVALAALALIACSSSAKPAADAGAVTVVGDGRPIEARSENVVGACLSFLWPEPAPPKSVLSSCTAGSGAIAVNVSAPAAIALGEKLTITWSATGIPADASINFFLVPTRNDAGDLGGGLFVESLTLCGDTHGTTEWDGQTLVQNNSETAAYRSASVVPGDYHIAAVVFAGTKLSPILGYPLGPTPSARHGEASSSLVHISGSLGQDAIKRELIAGARNRASTLMEAFVHSSTLDAIVTMDCTSFTGPDADQNYCAAIHLTAPLAGSLRSCKPEASAYTEVATTGSLDYAPGVLPFPTARDKALAAFPRTKTPGDRKLVDWTYRPDDGGYWAFALYQSGDQDPDDVVVARVRNDGASCLVGSFTWNAWSDAPDLAAQTNLACR